MRFQDLFRTVAVGAALVGALAVMGASAVIPIPVVDEDRAGWQDGVYVQPKHEPNRGPLAGCQIHVQTTVDGIGETMTAEDGDGNVYSAPVRQINEPGTRTAAGGRATFFVEPGVTLTTTNTDPVVSGSCPAA